MTYGEVYKSFKEETGIDGTLISDYRPCCKLHEMPNIPNAIIVWLKSGHKIVYIMKNEVNGEVE
jgi:hypothetical protein